MSTQTQLAKAKLIETAAALVHRQGWTATGINQILVDSEVPKGSFYYHFKTKEELGAAIIRYHGAAARSSYAATLLNRSLSGRDALKRYFEQALELHRSQEWRWGCPVGSFAAEIGTLAEKINVACREVLSEGVEALSDAIARGQQDSSIRAVAPAQELGQAVSFLWQGALVFAKTQAKEEPLLIATRQIGLLLGCNL